MVRKKADMGSWLSAADPAGRVAWKLRKERIWKRRAPKSLEFKEDMLDWILSGSQRGRQYQMYSDCRRETVVIWCATSKA